MDPGPLPFLDRVEELRRLTDSLRGSPSALVVLYGRRRLGKSRLVQEALHGISAAYYVGDDRDAALQRESVSREMDRVVPGFARVAYPDWPALLDRWWADSPDGSVLALDEFPRLVAVSAELPSVLQKRIDARSTRTCHVVLAGSSQRMMHGLVLSGSAPLFGRAQEILRVGPLGIGWLRRAISVRSAAEAVDHFAVWGGVPRYWELARKHAGRVTAVKELILDPLGVLHRAGASIVTATDVVEGGR